MVFQEFLIYLCKIQVLLLMGTFSNSTPTCTFRIAPVGAAIMGLDIAGGVLRAHPKPPIELLRDAK
jgi:hypothetical protein